MMTTPQPPATEAGTRRSWRDDAEVCVRWLTDLHAGIEHPADTWAQRMAACVAVIIAAERDLTAAREQVAALQSTTGSQCDRCGKDIARETSYGWQVGNYDPHRYCIPCWDRLLADLRELHGIAPTLGGDA